MVSLLKYGKLFLLSCRISTPLFNLILSFECALLKIAQQEWKSEKFAVNKEKIGL